MNTEDNLCEKIKEICIEQLCTANTEKSPYKARYADSSSDDKDNTKIEINEEDAREYIEAIIEPDEYKDYDDIFRRLLISGQNRNRMPKVINFMGREEKFKEILCGNGSEKFSYKKVLQSFYNNTQNKDKAANILLNKFKKNFKIKENITEANQRQKKYKSLWQQYALFIIDAALFMKEICKNADVTEGIDENCHLKNFKASLNKKASAEEDEYAVQKYVANEISGIGFTLACDFLKEIGYPIAKPDTHIVKYLRKKYPEKLKEKEEKLLNQKNSNLDTEEIAAVELMNDLAEKNNCSVYTLDKLIWLCCSGNYYKKGNFKKDIIIEPKSLRDLFLEKI